MVKGYAIINIPITTNEYICLYKRFCGRPTFALGYTLNLTYHIICHIINIFIFISIFYLFYSEINGVSIEYRDKRQSPIIHIANSN